VREAPAPGELRIRYARGSGRLVVTASLCALLPEDCPDALVDALWRLPAPDVLVVARALLVEQSLPDDLALAVTGTSTATVLLRGAAIARSASVTHAAHGARTWREIALPLEGLALQLVSGAETASLPLAGGVVSAVAVTWVTEPSVPSTPAPTDLAGGDPASEAGASTQGPVAPASPSIVGDLPDPAPALLAPLSETLRPDDLPQLGAHEGRPTVEEPVAEAIDQVTALAEPEGDDDSYDRLFGATEHVSRRPAPHAASGPTRATPVEPVGPPPTEHDDSEASQPEPGHVDAPASVGSVSGVPLISSVPGAAPSTSSVPLAEALPPAAPTGLATTALPVASVPDSLDDLSGLTIARSALVPLRTATGPLVHGVHCPGGHANPVEAVVCRVCGIEVPAQSATTLTRPPLGALVAVDVPPGAPTRIVLEGPLLLGRRPTLDGQSGPVPTLVTVASPDNDLSRNHLRINLDGWHVLVTDLGSTNGTVVELPGEQPERIHPQRPTMITPGTRVTLADVATYIYEVTA
jgi:hypothetical protein